MLTCTAIWEMQMLYLEGFAALPPHDLIMWWFFNCQGMV